MGKLENDALRRKKNEHFLRAFEYVATTRQMNQGELATIIGSKSAYISGYRSGTRPVQEKVIDALIRESCVEPAQQIYREYLDGNSDIMLLANVTDEEMAEVERRKNNPDYDIMQKRLHDAESRLDEELKTSKELLARPDNFSTVEPSSIMNAALAAQMQTIEALKSEKATLIEAHARELKTKDDLIQSLYDQLAAKDQIIAEQKSRLIDYRHTIDSHGGLEKYPFHIGSADSQHPANP